MIHVNPTEIVPIALFAFVGIVLVYSGVWGLRGRDLSVPAERFGSRLGVVKGKAARVLGLIFLIAGSVTLYGLLAMYWDNAR